MSSVDPLESRKRDLERDLEGDLEGFGRGFDENSHRFDEKTEEKGPKMTLKIDSKGIIIKFDNPSF